MSFSAGDTAPLIHLPPQGLREGHLRAGITSRLGFPEAVSKAPDSPDRALTRELLAQLLHVEADRLSWVRQVHGAECLDATQPGLLGEADALATTDPSRLLLISVADCVPVLFWHAKSSAHAAAHAGWRGVVAGVIDSTLDWFDQQRVPLEELRVWLGPHICPEHFEVGPEVAEQFDLAHVQPMPEGKNPHVDLAGAITRQLESRGIPAQRIAASPYCTFGNDDLFWSYRRDGGICGRHVAFVRG